MKKKIQARAAKAKAKVKDKVRKKVGEHLKKRGVTDEQKIKAIQRILGVEPDGIWGPQSQAALDALLAPEPSHDWHEVLASSFADPADIEAFEQCKEEGHSDDYCFSYGDNGIGCWGDSTKEGTGPSCALPPDDMEDEFGTVAAAKNKPVLVESGGKAVKCILKDRMPWKKNITNGTGLDLNPDACAALGLEPPLKIEARWRWA